MAMHIKLDLKSTYSVAYFMFTYFMFTYSTIANKINVGLVKIPARPCFKIVDGPMENTEQLHLHEMFYFGGQRAHAYNFSVVPYKNL